MCIRDSGDPARRIPQLRRGGPAGTGRREVGVLAGRTGSAQPGPGEAVRAGRLHERRPRPRRAARRPHPAHPYRGADPGHRRPDRGAGAPGPPGRCRGTPYCHRRAGRPRYGAGGGHRRRGVPRRDGGARRRPRCGAGRAEVQRDRGSALRAPAAHRPAGRRGHRAVRCGRLVAGAPDHRPAGAADLGRREGGGARAAGRAGTGGGAGRGRPARAGLRRHARPAGQRRPGPAAPRPGRRPRAAHPADLAPDEHLAAQALRRAAPGRPRRAAGRSGGGGP